MANLNRSGAIPRATPRWPTPPQETIGMTDDYLRPTRFKVILYVFYTVIDPLFLYTYRVAKASTDYNYDTDANMFGALTSLRMLDTIYLLSFIFCDSPGESLCFWRRDRRRRVRLGLKDRVGLASTLALNSFLLFLQLLSLSVQQPLLLLFLLTIHYGLRIYILYGLLSPKVEAGKWLRSILDGFPFILSAHLIGAIWYFLAVLRELQCREYICEFEVCNQTQLLNITLLKVMDETCSGKSMTFDLGIYANAIQSGMTRSTFVPLKILQGFWWGLRNLSSLGSNLQVTSFFVKTNGNTSYWAEICFSIMILISGLLLFMFYLNQRVEEFKKRSVKRKLRQEMQNLNPDIDLWLSNNALPKSLKVKIRKMVHIKIEENNFSGIDTILSILPLRYRRDIMSQLGLTALKKVPSFNNMDERVLKAVCEYLRPVIYAEDRDIFREGEPLDKMLFIRQGSAWSYTPIGTNSIQGSLRCSSDIKCLEKGDFFGQEIIEWATSLNPFSDIPVSRKVVKCQSKVEAFTIRAKDLRSVVCKFWLLFSLNEPDPQRRERLAASFVLAKWGPRRASPAM